MIKLISYIKSLNIYYKQFTNDTEPYITGADPTITDRAGRTAVEYVNSTEIASILHSAIEKVHRTMTLMVTYPLNN